MQISELLQLLEAHPQDKLQFVLPSGEPVPAHFHVTEVARVEKNFVDCGGTRRNTLTCQLQLWTANDVDHQLHAHKLGKIMKLAEPILKSADLPIEVEFGATVAALYSIRNAASTFGTMHLYLQPKQTDCLAKDKCGIEGCPDTACC